MPTRAHGSGEKGFLVVAGGALREQEAAVLSSFVRLAGPRGRLAVLPTASAEPGRSASGAAEALRTHGAASDVLVLELSAGDAERADESDFTSQLARLDGVWISGGSQSRITAALRPEGRQTAGLRALRELLARGGVVGGSSAGAAVMSEVMITGGRSADALVHGVARGSDERGMGLAPGLGLFPWGITDQHFLARGRLGRLVVALQAARLERGWGVDEDGAFLADLSTATVTAIGPCSLALVDLSPADISAPGVRGARLALLGSGDRVHGPSGRVLPRPGRRALDPGRQPGFTARSRPRQDLSAPLEPWGRDGLLHLLEHLASDPTQPAVARGDGCELALSADERTRFLVGPDEDAGPCAVDVLLAVRAL